MNPASIQSDFLAARAKTAITVLNATGWDQGIVNPEHVSVDSVCFYVMDCQTQWVWSCSVPRESFFAALEQSKSAKKEAAIACCGQMITACAKASELTTDMQNDLALALVAYINITQAYQLTQRATKANHFGVIRYGATDTLRPFAMGGPAHHLLAADDISQAMQQVIAIDKANHPEWMGQQ